MKSILSWHPPRSGYQKMQCLCGTVSYNPITVQPGLCIHCTDRMKTQSPQPVQKATDHMDNLPKDGTPTNIVYYF